MTHPNFQFALLKDGVVVVTSKPFSAKSTGPFRGDWNEFMQYANQIILDDQLRN